MLQSWSLYFALLANKLYLSKRQLSSTFLTFLAEIMLKTNKQPKNLKANEQIQID